MSQLRINIIKSLICFFAIAALLVVFLRSLVPNISPLHVFPYIALGIFVFAFALYSTIIIRGGFNQWSINKGAIDPAWLWFAANPPGLDSFASSNTPATLTQDAINASVATSIACSVDIASACSVSSMDSGSY
ncbi:hypothetical protein ACO0LD_00485 [Undibacterium sp. Ji83W]|uniref:hypothetical protein n=1 Tax=Undibacterium sp. Ji83W TaxID=3413043 RepID=UPI003BF1793E